MKKSNPSGQQSQDYQIKPKQREKFKPGEAKDKIKKVLVDQLRNQGYFPDAIQQLCKDIARDVMKELKEMGKPRYKFMVQVSIGEQKGQGVRVGSKCFWDFDTDYVASETYQNDNLFCLCTVYAVYLY